MFEFISQKKRSICSYHHQPLVGVAIGLLAAGKLIGLSKYTRISQTIVICIHK